MNTDKGKYQVIRRFIYVTQNVSTGNKIPTNMYKYVYTFILFVFVIFMYVLGKF